jgi:superfamily I DNA/RNA helicase
MATKLVTPATNSLLVLYDDAQSIYQRKRRKFNFAKLGIKAVGTTSVLRLNYRNTAEVLTLAMQCAQGIVSEKAGTDDDMQTVQPATAGRRGPMPVLITAANGHQEAILIAERIAAAIADGTPTGDIAVLCRIKKHMDVIEHAITQHRIACQSMNAPNFKAFAWTAPSVKLVTLHSAKGLEFPFVFISGLDCMPWMGESLEEELRLLYVGMTRATHRLVLTAAGSSPVVNRVRSSLETMAAQFEVTN